MVTESGLKLRTKLESAKSLSFTSTDASNTVAAGAMTVVGDTLGAVVEHVGTSGQAADDTYLNGADGILVYEAEKLYLPKATGAGESFTVGTTVYYDSTAKKVTPVSTSNTACGRALEAASTTDTDVLMDLIVLS